MNVFRVKFLKILCFVHILFIFFVLIDINLRGTGKESSVSLTVYKSEKTGYTISCTLKERRMSNMTDRKFYGVDVDDMIYGKCDGSVSER